MRLALLSVPGVALFLWPFFGGTPPTYLPAMAVAVAAVVALALLEFGARSLDSRGLALLAALAALDAGLRLALVTGIGGFSPVFFLILCAGFVFGPTFGFLTGALALMVSALATGGIGPWLPYQVFAAGWVGAAAGLATGRRLWVLAVIGAVTGLACRSPHGRLGLDHLLSWDGWLRLGARPQHPGCAPAIRTLLPGDLTRL